MTVDVHTALVTTEWLAERLSDEGLVVAEVDENPDLYDEGHIPGAVKLHWQDDLQDELVRDVVAKDEFERLMGVRGITEDTTVVLYGDKNNWFAAFAYWYLKLYGHEDVRLLDGGRQKWIEEGRGLTFELPSLARAIYMAKDRDESIRVRRDEVLATLGAAGVALVDVRSPQEYAGELLAPPGYEQEGGVEGRPHPGRAVRSLGDRGSRRRDVQERRRAARHVRGEGCDPGQGSARVLPDRRALGAHVVRAARAPRLRERQELRRVVDRVGQPRRRPDRALTPRAAGRYAAPGRRSCTVTTGWATG